MQRNSKVNLIPYVKRSRNVDLAIFDIEDGSYNNEMYIEYINNLNNTQELQKNKNTYIICDKQPFHKVGQIFNNIEEKI